MTRFAIMASGIVILTVCGPAYAAEASYRCKDGTRLGAVFAGGPSGPGSATITFADGTALTLPQALSADGGRYVSGATEFWIKGRGATLTRNGRATTCTTAR